MRENHKNMKKNYKNEYNKSHYDRIDLFVPKGEKERLQELAKAQGKSLNAFILDFLNKDKEDILKKMQVAESNARKVAGISGNTHTGYTVALKPGYFRAGTRDSTYWCRTRAEVRQSLKHLTQDIE